MNPTKTDSEYQLEAERMAEEIDVTIANTNILTVKGAVLSVIPLASLLRVRDEWDAAVKVLEGRTGVESDQLTFACEQYIAAEDCLPDEFDNECYTLSGAVESLLEQRDRHEKENDALKAELKGTLAKWPDGTESRIPRIELDKWLDRLKDALDKYYGHETNSLNALMTIVQTIAALEYEKPTKEKA